MSEAYEQAFWDAVHAVGGFSPDPDADSPTARFSVGSTEVVASIRGNKSHRYFSVIVAPKTKTRGAERDLGDVNDPEEFERKLKKAKGYALTEHME